MTDELDPLEEAIAFAIREAARRRAEEPLIVRQCRDRECRKTDRRQTWNDVEAARTAGGSCESCGGGDFLLGELHDGGMIVWLPEASIGSP